MNFAPDWTLMLPLTRVPYIRQVAPRGTLTSSTVTARSVPRQVRSSADALGATTAVAVSRRPAAAAEERKRFMVACLSGVAGRPRRRDLVPPKVDTVDEAPMRPR